MDSKQHRDGVGLSLLSYVMLILLVIVGLKKSFFEPFLLGIMVVSLLCIIRDITPFLGDFTRVMHRTYDWKALYTDIRIKALTISKVFFFINRVCFFPLIFSTYIIFILVRQLDLFRVSSLLGSSSWIEYVGLGLLLLSGCLTVFYEDVDRTYIREGVSKIRTRLFLIFSLILSIGSLILIFHETSTLGLLSIPISMISGLLVYLIAILMLEDVKLIH